MKTARKNVERRAVDSEADSDWLSVPQAARELGISYGGVLARALRKELETQRIADRTFVSRASVERAKQAS